MYEERFIEQTLGGPEALCLVSRERKDANDSTVDN